MTDFGQWFDRVVRMVSCLSSLVSLGCIVVLWQLVDDYHNEKRGD